MHQALVETVRGQCIKLVVRNDHGDVSGASSAALDLWCVSNSAATFVSATSGQHRRPDHPQIALVGIDGC